MTYQAPSLIKCLFCESAAIGRKLCRSHYRKMYAAGRIEEFPLLGPDDVFHSKYVKLESGCWEWKATRNKFGYGIFLLPGGKQTRAHRYMFEQINGNIPHGKVIMHACDNPPCVNPAHLSIGTKLENNRQAWSKGRRIGGDKHWKTKIPVAHIPRIQKMSKVMLQREIASIYGVDPSTISQILGGKRRKGSAWT